MKDQFLPATDRADAADGAPEREMENLLLTCPDLESLEPYYIEWEFIWPM